MILSESEFGQRHASSQYDNEKQGNFFTDKERLNYSSIAKKLTKGYLISFKSDPFLQYQPY